MARLLVQQVSVKLITSNIILVIIISLNDKQHVKSSFIDFIIEKISEFKENLIYSVKKLAFFIKKTLTSKLIILPPDEQMNDMKYSNFDNGMTVMNGPPIQVTTRKLKRYIVRTKDGYILTLHRVPPRKGMGEEKLANRTVLLHHGLLGSSADWLMLGPGNALPYILSMQGYDVWLANARGNCFSRNHISKTKNTNDFWDFSFQEIGEYDLPAIIKYIKKKTKSEEPINYIGHSMGATAVLVLLSVKPEFNKYLRVIVLLAPLAIMTRLRGPMANFWPLIAEVPRAQVINYLGQGEFMPSKRVPSVFADQYCAGRTMLCKNSLLFITGGLQQDVGANPEFLSRLLLHIPAGGSTKTILHYAQIVKNKKFHRFGKENEEFRIEDITTPVIIFSSNDDWISNVLDNEVLYTRIVNPVAHIILENEKISHTEFVWGINAIDVIFPKIVKLLESQIPPNQIRMNISQFQLDKDLNPK